MKIGMLTGGGDCPGLNAVIRAVVRKGVFHYQDQFVGFMEGWRGLLDDNTLPLDLARSCELPARIQPSVRTACSAVSMF
jgi:6-phosphofructokinase